MQESAIEYLLVLPVRFHRVSAGRVAAESAFCEHLRALRALLAPRFDRLRVAAPAMDPAEYARESHQLGTIDEEAEAICWVELHPVRTGTAAFWFRHFVPLLARLWSEVRRADLVHTGISHNLWRPFEFASLLMAVWLRKKSICVHDIDLRDDARMNFLTGRWSRKSMFLCQRVYDPLRNLQLELAVRRCSLVLLKGRRLCRDFGRGRSNVKYFLDSAFSGEQVIPAEVLQHKLASLADPTQPLELVYFGRLTGYKGVDRCIEAVALASRRARRAFRLHLIGSGEEEAFLVRHAQRLGIAGSVVFHGSVPYGPRLFQALYPLHLMLAAPLSEDTPRSALDALACGIPIVAFDTEYYSDLAASGAVDLAPWPSVDGLAKRLQHFARDKRHLIPMARKAVEFAHANTQQDWLRARVDWSLALYDRRPDVPEEIREASPV